MYLSSNAQPATLSTYAQALVPTYNLPVIASPGYGPPLAVTGYANSAAILNNSVPLSYSIVLSGVTLPVTVILQNVTSAWEDCNPDITYTVTTVVNPLATLDDIRIDFGDFRDCTEDGTYWYKVVDGNGCEFTGNFYKEGTPNPIGGCMDSSAMNYDPTATMSDGSCVYCVYGCMDASAFNYSEHATCDNGGCIAVVHGCTDPNASNYNGSANVDDGSCRYAPPPPDLPVECVGNIGYNATDSDDDLYVDYANGTYGQSQPGADWRWTGNYDWNVYDNNGANIHPAGVPRWSECDIMMTDHAYGLTDKNLGDKYWLKIQNTGNSGDNLWMRRKQYRWYLGQGHHYPYVLIEGFMREIMSGSGWNLNGGNANSVVTTDMGNGWHNIDSLPAGTTLGGSITSSWENIVDTFNNIGVFDPPLDHTQSDIMDAHQRMVTFNGTDYGGMQINVGSLRAFLIPGDDSCCKIDDPSTPTHLEATCVAS